MEKRIFSAVLISLALLWLWSALAPKFFPELARPTSQPVAAVKPAAAVVPAQAAPVSSGAPSAAVASKPAVAAIAPTAAAEEHRTIVEAPEFVATFSNRGAELVSFRLKNYTSRDKSMVDLVKARETDRSDFPFAVATANAGLTARLNTALYALDDRTEGSERVLEFKYASADGVSATKTFRFTKDFPIGVRVALTPPVPFRIEIGPGIRTLDPEEKDSQFNILGNGVVQRDDSLKVVNRDKADRFNAFPTVQYVGIEDNYFLSILQPKNAGGGVLRAVDVGVPKDKKREIFAGVSSGPDGVVAATAYFVPKQTALLDRLGLEKTLQFGVFGIIGRFLLTALVWINKFTKNYGFAIIVLTLLIKLALFPLQQKSMSSMKRMQKLQPKVDSIKARYKKSKTDADQRQKMNMEVMKLYQDEGVNPMGGCLPMAVQLPILWGFYGLLSRAIELRGAPFIWWIHDLSVKDPYYITPILMTATMFAQQAITPSTQDPTQRRAFLIMPLVFGFIFKEFPSGLVLYWLVQNLLTIGQQMLVNRKK